MITETELRNDSELSQSVAPEELRVGDFVCELKLIWEMLRRCDSDSGWRTPELFKLELLPFGSEAPRKVIGINLPFLLLQSFEGKHEMLDVRRYKLARVSERFARKARKRLRRDKTRAEAIAKTAEV